MLRSKTGIERLINLLMIVYSLMTLLPFYDSLFFPLADKSPQETRFLIDRQIQQELFFATFEIQPTSSKINFYSFLLVPSEICIFYFLESGGKGMCLPFRNCWEIN